MAHERLEPAGDHRDLLVGGHLKAGAYPVYSRCPPIFSYSEFGETYRQDRSLASQHVKVGEVLQRSRDLFLTNPVGTRGQPSAKRRYSSI